MGTGDEHMENKIADSNESTKDCLVVSYSADVMDPSSQGRFCPKITKIVNSIFLIVLTTLFLFFIFHNRLERSQDAAARLIGVESCQQGRWSAYSWTQELQRRHVRCPRLALCPWCQHRGWTAQCPRACCSSPKVHGRQLSPQMG